MKFLLFNLAIALFAVAAFGADYETEDSVIVLTDANFEATVTEKEILLIEFYAPWCGHCKKLAPEFAEAAETLGARDEPLYIAKLDATAHKEAAGNYEIQGFPTLKLFKGLDNVSDYEGERTAAAIVSFMIKKSGPVAKAITAADVEGFKKEADVVVVGSFSAEGTDSYKAFMKVADNNDMPFAVITGAAEESVVLYKNFDEGSNTLTENLDDAEALNVFIGGNRLPLVIPFNAETSKVLFGDSQPIRVQVLNFYSEDDKSSADVVAAAAKKYKGKALFVALDESNDRVSNYFGLSEDDFPTFVVVHMAVEGGMKKFMPSGDMSTLESFVAEYFEGELKPTLKSDDIPESQDEAVYVLVGKAFEEIALDDSKDVFVEFYAPWCGHCKSLAPKYEELAEKFTDVESVVIAKMDSTANEIDHPDVNIQGFPTLKFFPANSDGKVMDYDGPRETDDLYDFIIENAGAKIVESSDDKDEL